MAEIIRYQGASAPAATDKQFSMALGLVTDWEPGEMPPKELSYPDLLQAESRVEAMLAPATVEELAVAMDKLIRFARAFGVKIGDDGDLADAVGFYREHLGQMPADLLMKAVDHVIGSYRYGHRLPPPGDFKAAVNDEWCERIRVHGRMRRLKPMLVR